MFHCTLPRHTPLWALLLCALSSASQAQSAYTLTKLLAPNLFTPEAFDMNNAGKVVGTTTVSAGFGWLSGIPILTYRGQGVTWSSSTASSISASKTPNYYVPYRISESGVTLGYRTNRDDPIPFSQLYAEQNGKVTVAMVSSPPYNLAKSALGGVNKAGVAAVTADQKNSNQTVPYGANAVLVQGGTVSQILERPPSYVESFAHSINDQGMVAGALRDSYYSTGGGDPIRAAVWTNGQLTWVGELQTEARVVNNAGQVLVAKGRSAPISVGGGANNWRYKDMGNPVKGSAFVLLGTAVQTIGRDDQVVNATDMNNVGTVVGCADNVPFIWKNGVMLDLVQEVNSKGAKLPQGVVVECPIAINDAGSILTSYRTSATSTGRTWVRINAKP